MAAILLVGGMAGASAAPAPPPMAADNPSAACVRAAATAERRWALPAHLLLAIGTVESGRRDPATGQTLPWPWSANAGGTSYIFAQADEASRVVGWLQARGVGSIDVGCFQVNLHHHPGAFAGVAQGFDPDTNADYAGRFLRRLFERSGSWELAVGDYHSADPALGGAYRARVLHAWRGLAAAGSLPVASLAVASLAAPSLAVAAPTGDPHVLLSAASAAAIPVYTPATLPPALRAALGLPIIAK